MKPTEEQMVERARKLADAFNREDFDRVLEFVHPEVVFARPGGLSDVRGTDAVREWMEPDAIEFQSQELVHIESAGPGKLLTRNHVVARGTGSGIEMETFTWNVWTFNDDGLVTRFEYFLDHDEAAAREAAEPTG